MCLVREFKKPFDPHFHNQKLEVEARYVPGQGLPWSYSTFYMDGGYHGGARGMQNRAERKHRALLSPFIQTAKSKAL